MIDQNQKHADFLGLDIRDPKLKNLSDRIDRLVPLNERTFKGSVDINKSYIDQKGNIIYDKDINQNLIKEYLENPFNINKDGGEIKTFQPGGEYKVKSGDTFSEIASKNNMSLQNLIDANPGIDIDKLSLDQVINIPKEEKKLSYIEHLYKDKPKTDATKKVLETHTKLLKKYKELQAAKKAKEDKPIYDDYFKQLQSQENDKEAGWDPKTELWKPYPAPEEGGGYDIGPGFKLKDLSKERDWYKGITTEEMNTMMKDIFEEKKKYASDYINETYGKGTFENLSVPQQIILTDYQYNVKGGIKTFENFAKGVVNNDVDLMLKEHVRTSGGKPLGRRNQFTIDWINKYFKKRGGEFKRKIKRLKQQLKKYNEGGTISPLAYKKLVDLRLIKPKEEKETELSNGEIKEDVPSKELTFADVEINAVVKGKFDPTKKIVDEENISEKLKYKSGGEFGTEQQEKFYEEYIDGIFKNTKEEVKAKKLFDKLNRMYYNDSKENNMHQLDIIKSINRQG